MEFAEVWSKRQVTPKGHMGLVGQGAKEAVFCLESPAPALFPLRLRGLPRRLPGNRDCIPYRLL